MWRQQQQYEISITNWSFSLSLSLSPLLLNQIHNGMFIDAMYMSCCVWL